MKHSNFTILGKLTQFYTLVCKPCLYSILVILTICCCNNFLFAYTANANIDLFLSSTQETCEESGNGSVSVIATGGTPAYSYLWNTGHTTDIVYNLNQGTYTVTVTDSQNDSAVASIDVELSDEGLWIMMSTTADADCGPNGIAHVSAMTGVPPYTYLWDDPAMQTGEDAFNLYPATYSVTVTDSNGCTAIDSTIVGGTAGIISCNATVTSSYNEGVDISTFGGSDGMAAISVNGGNAPFTYEWSNNQTGPQATGLSAGTYFVMVTDSDSCTCNAEVTLHDPAKVGDFVWSDDNKNGIQDNGEPGLDGISITLEGTSDEGNDVLRVLVSGSDGSFLFGGLPGGTYKITFERPADYAGSPQNTGGDDTIDSDADPASGTTGFFNLALSECLLTIDAGFYPCGSIGDFVFQDGNENGIQDPWEAGVADVYVELYSAGPDGNLYTDDDVQEDWDLTGSDGLYLFECVEPGQYYIKFTINSETYTFSPQFQGNDPELDSNADIVSGNTQPISVVQGMPDDLSFDAGVFDVCDDFTYGGTIGQNQIICPGDEPETLHTVIPPSGGSGTPEYLWLKSLSGGSFPSQSWMEIPNSNTENYDPGPTFVTTYFIRCIRREGCTSFIIESENQVVITVLPEDDEYCQGNNIDPFNPELSAEVMASDEVMISWSTGPENELYYYYVERSFDTTNFEPITVLRGNANNNNSNNYHFMDTAPVNGRNYYRIKRLELISETIVYSNPVEVFFVDENQSFMAHPNPVSNTLKVETSLPRAENATLSLYNAMGQLLDVIELEAGETSVEVNMKDFANGLYFIHIPGDSDHIHKILKILKK